jgi:hypothetical protein
MAPKKTLQPAREEVSDDEVDVVPTKGKKTTKVAVKESVKEPVKSFKRKPEPVPENSSSESDSDTESSSESENEVVPQKVEPKVEQKSKTEQKSKVETKTKTEEPVTETPQKPVQEQPSEFRQSGKQRQESCLDFDYSQMRNLKQCVSTMSLEDLQKMVIVRSFDKNQRHVCAIYKQTFAAFNGECNYPEKSHRHNYPQVPPSVVQQPYFNTARTVQQKTQEQPAEYAQFTPRNTQGRPPRFQGNQQQYHEARQQ